jgi:hypothetical protein
MTIAIIVPVIVIAALALAVVASVRYAPHRPFPLPSDRDDERQRADLRALDRIEGSL